MAIDFSRRDALKAVVSAGTLAMIRPSSAAMADSPLRSRSGPIELTITPVSPRTVRIAIQPLRDGKPVPLESDGALIDWEWPSPVVRMRSIEHQITVQSGELSVSVSPDPL